MTPESPNLALIHDGLAAFSRGDFDAAVENMHADIEWHVFFRLPDLPADKTVYHGADEVRELWAQTKSGWDDLRVSVDEVLVDTDEMAIVRARFVGRVRDVDLEIDQVVFYIFELDHGLLRRLRPFKTEAEAFAAAGMAQRDG